ncbi:MAG: OB-fold nucleic acid binding domain-containing protein [Nitrososphaerota archaeon]
MVKIREVLNSKGRNLEIVGRIKSKEKVILPNIRLAKAVLEDETGSIILNLWREQVDQCDVGDLVRIKKAYVRYYKGTPELNTWEDIEVLERGKATRNQTF